MSLIRKLYYIALDLLETFVIAGAIFVVIYAFLFRLFLVNGDSMLPNFHNGEYIVTNLITLRLNPLKRGDVVVFQAPPNLEKDYIKRVIGLPGDRIIIKDGNIYLNGELLDEKTYLAADSKTYGEQFLRDGQEVTVPSNNYFVLGDNRRYSSDSRDWGFVSFDKIIGKSFIVAWPPTEIRIVSGMK
ncbi:MAG: signal peptidase I [Candidatus Levybacteria bacterium RIFCSPHIGHO2_01_FULL_36_15]|nr:MAG: signal peptidase I [Candidatus Levybacteria bacterium RIFCSPHIGHO2_01_FULL_36_15]